MSRPLSRAIALLGVSTLALGLAAVPASADPSAVAGSSTTHPDGGMSLLGQTSPMHDPTLYIEDDGTWYVYTTGLVNRENGGTIQTWSSNDDGITWQYDGTIWPEIPEWIDLHFAGGMLPDNLWAPELYKHGDTYYLYYAASRFGTDFSVTALATNTTLDPSDPAYEWVDQGPILESPVSGLPDGKVFNAIDPGIVEDEDGNPWMAIGSFWYGIFILPLEWPSGTVAPDWKERTVHIADRMMAGNPIESPIIAKHDGMYYLFTSFGYCCQGENSTYEIAVGRSDSVTGPYLDRDGRDMADGGGTIVLSTVGTMVGPGGQSVFSSPEGDYLAFHYYDGANKAIPYFPTLGIQRLGWVDGWPVADTQAELPAAVTRLADVTVAAGEGASLTATASGAPLPVAVWEIRAGDAAWEAVVSTTDRSQQGTGLENPVSVSALTLSSEDLEAADGEPVQVRVTWKNAFGSADGGTSAITISSAVDPTPEPTVEPTGEPTVEPTGEPTVEPTTEPTAVPSATGTTTAAPTGGSGSTGSGQGGTGSLPSTGASILGVTALAVVLAAVGVLTVRRSHAHQD